MRIAVLAQAWFAVPPRGYGGIEWVVSLLADGLAAAGHDVTLFASGDSRTKAKLSAVFEAAPSRQIGKSLPDLRHALACYDQADEFDVINDHSGPLAALAGGLVGTPVVHTLHGPLDGEPGEVYERIATRWGAVPEVIEDGGSGIIVEAYRDMPAALEQADALDPTECRRYVEEWFAPERMVASYLEAYEKAIDRVAV